MLYILITTDEDTEYVYVCVIFKLAKNNLFYCLISIFLHENHILVFGLQTYCNGGVHGWHRVTTHCMPTPKTRITTLQLYASNNQCSFSLHTFFPRLIQGQLAFTFEI